MKEEEGERREAREEEDSEYEGKVRGERVRGEDEERG